MSKIYTWVVVGLFLVLVPLGSWYYLNQGLQYRKQLLKEMEIKSTLNTLSDSSNLLLGNANLVVLDNTKPTLDIVNNLNEQFQKSNRFKIIFKDSVGTYPYLPENYMADEWQNLSGSTFVLLDTMMNVRNTYSNSMEEIKKMVEHISIIIPRQKDPDIKMKSN